MSTRLILFSHPATIAMRQGRFPDNDALDTRGITEAEAWRAQVTALIAAHVARLDDAHCVCSPSLCVLETANCLGIHAQTSPAVADANFGRWRGERIADVAASAPLQIASWLNDPDFTPPEGESFTAVRNRVSDWMAGSRRHAVVIALTHAAVIRAAILHALDAPATSFTRIDVPPLMITELRHGSNGWSWKPSR